MEVTLITYYINMLINEEVNNFYSRNDILADRRGTVTITITISMTIIVIMTHPFQKMLLSFSTLLLSLSLLLIEKIITIIIIGLIGQDRLDSYLPDAESQSKMKTMFHGHELTSLSCRPGQMF